MLIANKISKKSILPINKLNLFFALCYYLPCKPFVFPNGNRYFSNFHFHVDYPNIDEEKGRPHVNWKDCYHKGCTFRGKTVSDLRNHLNSMCCYIPRYLIHHV